jgi:lipoate-protein ligase B
MNLESKVANWQDIGIIPYPQCVALQKELVEKRARNEIPDTILCAQHPLEINFGASRKDNLLSGDLATAYLTLGEDDNDYTKLKGLLATKNIPFSHISRGGGATVLSPGQYAFYPISNLAQITGKPDLSGLADYKRMIDNVMLEIHNNLGFHKLKIHISGYDKELNQERRDIWVEKDSKSYKIGSKGVVVSDGIAHNGFVLYIGKESTQHFHLVKPCGYDHSLVSVTSAEALLGRKIESSVVYAAAKKAIQNVFGYKAIKENII